MVEKPKRVLVVDDVVFNQRVVATLLRRRGWEVTVAETGEAAVENCQSNLSEPFDVVLMDVNLPGIDGMQATTQIRKSELPDQPIIIGLSAHAGQRDFAAFRESGMDDCLAKPVDLENLIAMINRHVEGNEPGKAQTTDTSIAKASEAELMVLNSDSALQRIGSNRQLFLQFIGVFREDISNLIATAEQAAMTQNLKGLGDTAHRIRGMSANLSADRLSEHARRLEMACEEGQSDLASVEFENLKQELEPLESAFQKFENVN